MKAIKCLIAVFIFLNTFTTYSAQLQILEPRVGSGTQKGSIQEMTVMVIPQGNYMELDITLAFNAQGTQWKDVEDTLEVVFNFTLDERAMITDSYLYMDYGEKVRAMIIDFWSAKKIYEDYVKRRTDPSFVWKKNKNSYEMRIFPMAASLFRKAQINIQVPNDLFNGYEEIYLPFEWLSSAFKKPDQVTLWYFPNSEFTNPRINPDFTTMQFVPDVAEGYGNGLKMTIPADSAQNIKSLYVNSNLSTKNFISTQQFDNNTFYQLSVPLTFSTAEVPRQNICYILDYEQGKSYQKIEDVISALKYSIQKYSIPGDSFNIVLSGFKPIVISDAWLSVDSASVNQAFKNVTASSISQITHLFESVDKAIEFINNSKKPAIIYIISNSDAYGDYKVANEFINNITNTTSGSISFSVYSFSHDNYVKSYQIGGMTYRGNDYLYLNLVRMTKGASFYKVSSNDLPAVSFSKAMPDVAGIIDNQMVFTQLENGYVYQKYPPTIKLTPNSRFIEYGMINGALPMNIDIGYTFRTKFFNQKIKINANDVSTSNYEVHQLWTGQMIAYKEAQPQTNNTIYQLIDESMRHRVLSVYTAFLALEKTDKDTIVQDPSGSGGPVVAEDIQGLFFAVTPNPVSTSSVIHVSIPENLKPYKIKLSLSNMMGMIVRDFDLKNTADEQRISWDCKDNSGNILPSGVYFLTLQINGKRFTLNVVVN